MSEVWELLFCVFLIHELCDLTSQNLRFLVVNVGEGGWARSGLPK